VQVGGVGRYVEAYTDPEVLVRWGQVCFSSRFPPCAGILITCQCLYSQIIFYDFAIVLPKLAILLFYRRIFSIRTSNRTFKLATYIVGLLIVGWGVGVMITSIFQCSPISYGWDKNQHGHCINLLAFYRWLSLPNVLFDLAMLVMPLNMIWNMQQTVKQKVALSGSLLTSGM